MPAQLLVSIVEIGCFFALIALSYDPVQGTLSSGPAFQGLQPCPQLQQALRQLWIEAQQPAINPLPKPQPTPGQATKSAG